MNWITDLINWVSKLFQWWVIVLPWEKGIRIRLGKYQKLLNTGIYLKLPLIDTVFVQSVRLRYMAAPMQTVSTKDGKAISIIISVGYTIKNIETLYNTIFSPTATISNIVMGEVSQYCASNPIEECLPDKIQEACRLKLTGSNFGLGDISIKVIGFAAVRTYRLISDQSWFPEENNSLNRPI